MRELILIKMFACFCFDFFDEKQPSVTPDIKNAECSI